MTNKENNSNFQSVLRLKACTVTTRLYDCMPEVIIENGSDEPAFISGTLEIKSLKKQLHDFLKNLNQMQPNQEVKIISSPIEHINQQHTTTLASPRLLRLPDVLQRVGLQKSSIYSYVKNGTFPAPVKLSRRVVAWREQDIANWINGLMAAPAGIEPASTP